MCLGKLLSKFFSSARNKNKLKEYLVLNAKNEF
jgi:hypothetical protein